MIGRLLRLARDRWAVIVFIELSLLAWLLFLPYVMTAHGHLDFARHALGRDFVNLWTASHLEFTSHRLDIFDPPKFLEWERRLFDRRLPFHFWSYPPPALLLAAPLAPFPYFTALGIWSLAGVLLLAPAAHVFTGARLGETLLLAASPAVAVNIALGQNGAVTGCLILCGVALWDRRPRVAGALLGLLAFKPQLPVLLPLAALARPRPGLILAAAVSALTVIAASTLAFGLDAWRGFLGPTLKVQSIMLTRGRGPFMWMMPGVYMSVRALGGAAPLAAVAQVPFTLIGAVLTWLAYRSERPAALKGGVLILATLIATPQAFNYDLVAAAGPALLLLRDASIWRRVAGVALWILPVLLLAAQALEAPIGPPIIAAALAGLYTLPTGAPKRARRASMAAEAVSNT